MGIVKVLK